MRFGAIMTNRKFFGLRGLDKKISEYITQKTGFFIELGANDGITQNNTLYFERIGWKGLLIEPVPALYEKCKKNRPNAITVNYACVENDSIKEVPMLYSNLMSIVKGAQGSDEADRKWIEHGNKIQGIKSYELTVPARTLSSILDEHGISHIDMLILDVEGHEPSVLAGLDFSRHAPTYMVIEESGGNDIVKLVEDKYDFIAELSNRKFTRDLLFKVKG